MGTTQKLLTKPHSGQKGANDCLQLVAQVNLACPELTVKKVSAARLKPDMDAAQYTCSCRRDKVSSYTVRLPHSQEVKVAAHLLGNIQVALMPSWSLDPALFSLLQETHENAFRARQGAESKASMSG